MSPALVAGFLLDVLGDARVLSLAALTLSLVAYRRSRPVGELQRQIAELQLHDQQAKAASRTLARVRAEATARPDRIVLVNAGEAPARQVEIAFSEDLPRSPLIDGEVERLPLARLEPGERFPLTAAYFKGLCPPFDATIRWLDPDGTAREETVVVHQ